MIGRTHIEEQIQSVLDKTDLWRTGWNYDSSWLKCFQSMWAVKCISYCVVLWRPTVQNTLKVFTATIYFVILQCIISVERLTSSLPVLVCQKWSYKTVAYVRRNSPISWSNCRLNILLVALMWIFERESSGFCKWSGRVPSDAQEVEGGSCFIHPVSGL